MSVNDDKRDALKTALASADNNIDDLEIQWLTLKGATSPQVNDAWLEVFAITLLGTATGNFNTDAYAYLGNFAHTGALNDRWASFWAIALP